MIAQVQIVQVTDLPALTTKITTKEFSLTKYSFPVSSKKLTGSMTVHDSSKVHVGRRTSNTRNLPSKDQLEVSW